MKNINIGVVNLLISNKLKDSYFSNSLNEEYKKITTNFFDVVKNSPILQLEFNVFNNLENKYIDSDVLATRYIDNNIKLFEVYNIDEINIENSKLNSFINEECLDENKIKLYEAIDSLIYESLNDYDKINVDNVHESFTIVLNHIKEPKNKTINVEVNDNPEYINEEVIEIAIDKFNEKYEGLNEDDRTLLIKLIKSTKKEKQHLLEEYKSQNLMLLETVNLSKYNEGISKAITKINEMKYNSQTVEDDIISLHELKKGLK